MVHPEFVGLMVSPDGRAIGMACARYETLRIA